MDLYKIRYNGGGVNIEYSVAANSPSLAIDYAERKLEYEIGSREFIYFCKMELVVKDIEIDE